MVFQGQSHQIMMIHFQKLQNPIKHDSWGPWTDGWLARAQDPVQPEIRRMSKFVGQRILTSSWSLAGEDPESWRANHRFSSLRNVDLYLEKRSGVMRSRLRGSKPHFPSKSSRYPVWKHWILMDWAERSFLTKRDYFPFPLYNFKLPGGSREPLEATGDCWALRNKFSQILELGLELKLGVYQHVSYRSVLA